MSGKVRINLLGPFQLLGPNGGDCTPRGRKTCAMLALLALAPKHQRSRKWLQDKLWSDRGQAQGSASLRQALVELRRTLGAERDAVQSDRYSVTLDPERIEVDLLLGSEDQTQRSLQGEQLLEGFDINEPEFEEWLRQQRRNLETALELPPPAPRIEIPKQEAEADQKPVHLILKHTHPPSDPADVKLADCLLDAVALTIRESGSLSVVDRRGDRVPTGNETNQPAGKHHPTDKAGLVLRAQSSESQSGTTLRVLLSRTPSDEVIWSATAHDKDGRDLSLDGEAYLRRINQIASVATNEFVKARARDSAQQMAAAVCHEGAAHLFQLGGANFQLADRLFATAYELEPKGVYLGWRAYARTFMLAERQFTCRETVTDEAMEFLERAMEMDPHNSYIASFAAQVHNIINRSYVSAYEFANRSVELNPSNPIGWSQLGAAKCHLGQIIGGFEDTQFAVRISGSAPYRFQLAGISCIAGSMAGDVDRAVRIGEIGHALAPSFGPPLRYLSVLYLHQNREEESEQMVERLKSIEPDFSYSSLRDPTYPAAGLNTSGLLDILPGRQI